jgi:tight adherence protein C
MFACFYLVLSHAWAANKRVVARLRALGEHASPEAIKAAPLTQRRSLLNLLQRLNAIFHGGDPRKLDTLRTRLVHAGYGHPLATTCFMILRLSTVILLGLAVGLGVWLLFKLPMIRVATWAVAGAGTGYLLPSILLARQITRRQNRLQKGLPDAVDVLVLCLEGGLGFHAAMQWVADELDAAHADLGAELAMVYRDMQMGLPAGEAFQSFADRTGLESARDLAALLMQSDKLGVGLAKTLRSYSETARRQRRMKAEESAQKAAVKILFPTLIFIFPAIFIVLIGPAALQLAKLFTR